MPLFSTSPLSTESPPTASISLVLARTKKSHRTPLQTAATRIVASTCGCSPTCPPLTHKRQVQAAASFRASFRAALPKRQGRSLQGSALRHSGDLSMAPLDRSFRSTSPPVEWRLLLPRSSRPEPRNTVSSKRPDVAPATARFRCQVARTIIRRHLLWMANSG